MGTNVLPVLEKREVVERLAMKCPWCVSSARLLRHGCSFDYIFQLLTLYCMLIFNPYVVLGIFFFCV